MRPLVCALLLFGAGFAAFRARAQAVLLDPITRAQGSPSDYVFDVLQDRQGFLWMATDAGVARYDGRDFVTWTTAEGLPHNYTYALHELPDGRLIVGTFGGAAILERGRLRHLQGTEANVHAITHDPFGRFYLSGSEGVMVCERGRCRLLVEGVAISDAQFTEGPGGTLLIAMQPNRVARIRPSATRVEGAREDVPLPAGKQLVSLITSETALVTGPNEGLSVWDLRRQRPVQRLPPMRVRSLRVAPDSSLLIGGEDGAVWRVDRAGTRRVATAAEMQSYAVQALHEDYEGHLWVGLFGGGVRQLVQHSLRLPAPPLDRSILRLSRDRAGTVWMTTRQGLVARAADGALRTWPHYTLGLAEDYPGGGHYLTSNAGLHRLTAHGTRALLEEGNWVSALMLGPGDTLWTGTYGAGVRRLVGEREVAPPAPGGPPVVEAFAPGAHGAVWVLTRSEGAYRYAEGRWTNLRAGLPSAAVFSLLDEPDGTLWLGTDHGLVRQRGRERRVFDDAGRLRGQRLHALFRTGRDTLWVVADRLLYTVVGDVMQPVARGRLKPDDRVAIHAAVPIPEAHRLLLGTSAGLVEVDLRGGPPLPAPRVARLGDPEDGRVSGDTLRLAPGQRSVTLAFAPLTFGNGAPGRLQHRTSGSAWSEPTAERTVALAGLADGWHVLDVRAVNVEGRVSAQPVRVVLYVPPPWWRTWPARAAGLVLLLVLVAALVRRLSTHRLRARVRAFETEQRVQAERDRISRDLHDHVGAQLTGVLAGLELLGDEPQGSEHRLLDALRSEVRETIGALRTAIFTLQHPPRSFDELGRLLDRYVRDQARFRAVPTLRCTVDGRHAAPLEPFVALHLFRMAQEALQNALRHAGAARVLVHLHGTDEGVRLTVEDDGAFRPPDGTGHGLGIMQARAGEIGAHLDVAGAPEGTAVRVQWPGLSKDPDIVRTGDGYAGTVAVP